MMKVDDDWCMTNDIVPIVHYDLERAVDSLSIKKKNEFVFLTPTKVVALVTIETPAMSRFVIEIASAHGMTRSGRCFSPEELAHGVQIKYQGKRPISEGETEEF